MPSNISWCDSHEIPLETYNKQQPSAIMSYFSLRSTLYTLNYHSSRLFGIIIDVFNLDSIIYIHAHCPVIFHGRAIAMKFHWKPIYAITEGYYVVFFTKVYIIHTKLPF